MTVFISAAQQSPALPDELLDKISETEEEEIEDDGWLDDLQQFRKDPISINTAGEEELKSLRVLTECQIANLIAYRKLFGKLLHIYELQAVPGWQPELIRKLLPFLTIAEPLSLKEDFKNRWSKGEHMLMLRMGRVLESDDKYLGSPDRILFRYRFNFKNLLQFGILGDKDAGESFGRAGQKAGFDFYSIHFFARKLGRIEALALGDFTVRMGQGLIHWQGMTFRMGSDMMSIKRQGPALSPYRSAGEYYFFRGAGIHIKMKKIECTGFISYKKAGAQINVDPFTHENFISSIITSGYYRSTTEVVKKNNIHQLAAGGIFKYHGGRWNAAINGLYYQFSLPLRKGDEPYAYFGINGKSWYNISADYSFTSRNMHWFGEIAIDKTYNLAYLQGIVISVDTKAEVSVLYRRISPAYQSISGNANTQNSSPTNEEGIYAGITLRPFNGWRLDATADSYVFPWLKYRVEAPSRGYEFMLQLTYAPYKTVELYAKYKTSMKQLHVLYIPRQSLRLHITYTLNPGLQLRNRCEMVWYDGKTTARQNGFLILSDMKYRPVMKKYGCTLRVQYFETDGYDARIYAYENDVLYDYAIPAFSGQGWRYYLLVEYDLKKNFGVGVRVAQTNNRNEDVFTEIKLQARLILQ